MTDKQQSPWEIKPLDEWSIVGMNHYTITSSRGLALQNSQSEHYEVRCLYVAMTKDGRCIVEQGPDDEYLWNRLWRRTPAK